MKKKHKSKKSKTKKGFTILEALMSAFLLSVGIVAIIQLITVSLQSTIRSRDQVIAAQLAQEGVELIRNVRDNDWANGRGSFSSFPAASDTICIDISDDTNNFTSTSCDVSTSRLYLNASNKYTHSGGSQSKYMRKIDIIDRGLDEKTVISIVTWDRSDYPGSLSDCKIGAKCVYTESVLTDWN